jgi:hypothetical protein
MGYLVNSSFPVDFSQGLTLSGWFRASSSSDIEDGYYHMLCEFGKIDGFPSSISVSTRSFVSGVFVYCSFAGRSFAHPHTDYYIYQILQVPNDPPPGVHNVGTIEEYLAAGQGFVPLADFNSTVETGVVRSGITVNDAAAATIAVDQLAYNISINNSPPWKMETRSSSLYDSYFGTSGGYNWHTPLLNFNQELTNFNEDTWNHVLIACDVSGGIVNEAEVLAAPHDNTDASLTHSCPAHIIVNGVSSVNYASHSWPSGRVIGQTFENNSGPTYNANLNPTGSGIVAAGNQLFVPFNPSPSASMGLNINGGVAEPPVAKQYGDFQVWNTFIDPTVPANYAKFVKIKDGIGTPADPRIAAAFFGQQTILFRGKSSDASFYVNRGDAGPFSKTGTISDFTPAPSY